MKNESQDEEEKGSVWVSAEQEWRNFHNAATGGRAITHPPVVIFRTTTRAI
jgi:hypothetical protein